MEGKSFYAHPVLHSCVCKPVATLLACQMPYDFFYGVKHLNVFTFGSPYGTRTRVFAVKGRCPRPLDERTNFIRVLHLDRSDLMEP